MDRLLGVLLGGLIIALTTFLAWDFYDSGQHDANVQQTSEEIALFKKNMNQRYLRQPGRYGSSAYTAANLITLGIAPATTQSSPTSLANAWSGTITVTGATDRFYLDYSSIPDKDCLRILGQFSTSQGIMQVRVAATAAGLGGATAYVLPVSDTNAMTLCVNNPDAIRFEVQ